MMIYKNAIFQKQQQQPLHFLTPVQMPEAKCLRLIALAIVIASAGCTGKEDGEYVDPHNCSVYHICVEEDIFATQTCIYPEEFDQVNDVCTEDTAICDAVVDCGICPDDDTYIKIDCFNYYQCEKNDDAAEGEPEFEPVLKYCPAGTCFNAESTYCDLDP
ncbi:hypothetical protein Avbf_03657 [Armadillidium vulgare]|nr:hypothetical protein Avbf_03657 [Armadillidium vulgare]